MDVGSFMPGLECTITDGPILELGAGYLLGCSMSVYSEAALKRWQNPEYRAKHVGRKRSPETIAKVAAALKGRPRPDMIIRNRERGQSPESRRRISESKTKAWHEKGYGGKHNWVRTNFADPGSCETCGSQRYLDWASIEHTYTQNREDWLRLCRRCHQRLDAV